MSHTGCGYLLGEDRSDPVRTDDFLRVALDQCTPELVRKSVRQGGEGHRVPLPITRRLFTFSEQIGPIVLGSQQGAYTSRP